MAQKSKPVPSTAVTSPQVTLSAFEDILGQSAQAFFALMPTLDPAPAVMIAVVVGLQVREDFFDVEVVWRCCWSRPSWDSGSGVDPFAGGVVAR